MDLSQIENLKNHPYISKDISLKSFSNPYNIIILDNVFEESILDKMSINAYKYISRVNKPFGEVGEGSGLIYNALIYGMKEEDCVDGYDFFISKTWKEFAAKIFNLNLTQHIAISMHYHEGSKYRRSKDGWSHADSSYVSVIDDEYKDIKIVSHDCEYANDLDSNDARIKKVCRAVAVLFYFNNKWSFGINDGGGTSIYSSKDLKSPMFEVEPKNNRVMMFQINPLSYHGFKGANFNRTALVHWFHSNPVEYVYNNLELVKKKLKVFPEGDITDRWKKGPLWRLDKHPDYNKYFKTPYEQIFKKE